MNKTEKKSVLTFDKVYLCLHVTKANPFHKSKVVGAGIYDTPNPKMNPGVISVVIMTMHGITKSIAERKLVKLVKLIDKMYADLV